MVDDTDAPVTVLRSTVMDPWPLTTGADSFLDTIEQALRQALAEWTQPRNLHQVEGWFANKRAQEAEAKS